MQWISTAPHWPSPKASNIIFLTKAEQWLSAESLYFSGAHLNSHSVKVKRVGLWLQGWQFASLEQQGKTEQDGGGVTLSPRPQLPLKCPQTSGQQSQTFMWMCITEWTWFRTLLKSKMHAQQLLKEREKSGPVPAWHGARRGMAWQSLLDGHVSAWDLS